MKQSFILFFILSLILGSCSNGGEKEINTSQSMIPTTAEAQKMKKESSAITQSLPTLMVIPADRLLKDLRWLATIDNQGVTDIINHENYLLSDFKLFLIV
jgi:ABC-type enterochelin transport system substrate-binding protein